MFIYVAPEARVAERHALRPVQTMMGQALATLYVELEARHSHTGRLSIPARYLLSAALLTVEQNDSADLFSKHEPQLS